MLSTMNNLAGLYREQGRYEEAAPLLAEGLQLGRKKLRPHHPNTLLVQLNGAVNLAALGRDESAVRQLAPMEPQLLTWLGSELYTSEAPGVRIRLVASQVTYQNVAINLALRPNAGPEAA